MVSLLFIGSVPVTIYFQDISEISAAEEAGECPAVQKLFHDTEDCTMKKIRVAMVKYYLCINKCPADSFFLR